MTEFIEHPSDQVRSLVADPDPETSRRPLRVLLVGDRQDVLATIQNLHYPAGALPQQDNGAAPCLGAPLRKPYNRNY